MTSICRIAFYMTALSTAVVGGGCMTGEPEPAASEVASELASDCESGANGFIDISDGLSGTVRRSADLGFNVLLTLESGTVSGATRGWAKISGATIPGDQVSMDWTVTGGAPPKVSCGPFTVGSVGMSKTSAAKVTSSSPTYQFRACGHLAGVSSICTTWW